MNNWSLASPVVNASRPIGVFDSGVGGLTVWRELQRQLPRESIVYFGDTARLPYGDRSREEIVAFGREILHWMSAQGVKMVLVACNTSSALALEEIREEFDIPILGLILPGARAAVDGGRRRIGTIATPATVSSHAYQRAILEIDPQVRVWEVPCPKFVPLIEASRCDKARLRAAARTYLEPLRVRKIEALIYGCTHYPLIESILQEILPDVDFIDPARSLVAAVDRELEVLGLKNTGQARLTRFCVSGAPGVFARSARRWLGQTPIVEQVSLAAMSTLPLSMEI
ncbi:MAG: glutamate racemase [Cyanobacteria bacterium J06641_5]